MDRALADELRALEQVARDMGHDVLGDALLAASALAHQADHGTLARIGGLLSVAALTDGPTFSLLFAASRAIVHRISVSPAQALRRYLVDEVVTALGRKTLELDAAHNVFDAEMKRGSELRAALVADAARLRSRAEGAEDVRDAVIIERDVALARLREAGLRPGFACCHAAMAEALAQHARAAHPEPPELRALQQSTPAPANDAGASAP